MCCFSRPVKRVFGTNIFARGSTKGRQFIVYSMSLMAEEDLAMILPLPVPAKTADDAVKFIDLSKFPKFFADLRAGFPEEPAKNDSRRPLALGGGGGIADPLKVVQVGSFEASFVPTVKDFDRLDERFRLPTGVWDKLPGYKNHGFAVFKLKKGESKVHPMAFEFPRANPKKLFFPTVHIHDGQVHAKADFDHALYCQHDADNDEAVTIFDWRESPQPAGLFMKIDAAQGIVDKNAHCYLREMHGMLKNEDLLV